MDRNVMVASLDVKKEWDIIVIGGGASGLGTALDAASRGYRTLLLEQGDFAQGTSSRSTKLIHGGLRYLRQGAISLVYKALHERTLLLQNAPHLVHPLSFIMPTCSWSSKLFYFTGIKLYDALAGNMSFGSSHMLSKEEALKRLPTVNQDRLSGALCFYDGQFDDARLAINLAQTIVEQMGIVVNYMPVQKLLKVKNKIAGVAACDLETGKSYEIRSKVVVNATGVFTDSIRRLDVPDAAESIVTSQGTHIVLDRSFFPGDSAMIIPGTEDGRVLFAIPWYDKVLVGTTDTPSGAVSLEPRPKREEVEYLLSYAGKYLTKTPAESDILSLFAGLRPLLKPKEGCNKTSELSRDYVISVAPSQLVTLTGGKWTVYRKMGEDAVNVAAKVAHMPFRASQTRQLSIHGGTHGLSSVGEWRYYGSDSLAVEQMGKHHPEWIKKIDTQLPCRLLDVVWAVRNEMARRLEDVLSRRTRCLLLNARASLEIAPQVAALMRKELGQSSEWEIKEVTAYRNLAEGYSYSIQH